MGLQELSGLDPSYVIATITVILAITLKPALEQLRRKVARKKGPSGEKREGIMFLGMQFPKIN